MASKNSNPARKLKTTDEKPLPKKPLVKKTVQSKYGACYAVEMRAVPKK